jgi:stage II sporulation SpoE-like protein
MAPSCSSGAAGHKLLPAVTAVLCFLLLVAAAPARAAEASAADFRAALRHDALSLPIGFFLLGIGLAAGAVALACCVHLDLTRGALTYAGAGHPAPLLWRAAERRVEELAQGGIVMGRLRRAAYGEAAVPLAAGDRLLLYTDGIPEARNPAGEPFGDERLRELLAGGAALPAGAIADALVRRVQEWTGRAGSLEDDLTLVVAAVEDRAGLAPRPPDGFSPAVPGSAGRGRAGRA